VCALGWLEGRDGHAEEEMDRLATDLSTPSYEPRKAKQSKAKQSQSKEHQSKAVTYLPKYKTNHILSNQEPKNQDNNNDATYLKNRIKW